MNYSRGYLTMLFRLQKLRVIKREINLLKTKGNLLYTRNQFVPRSKHF